MTEEEEEEDEEDDDENFGKSRASKISSCGETKVHISP